VRHLWVDEVLEIHARLIRTFGGPAGIRDSGLLWSALFRPRTGYQADIAERAAALFESLPMTPPPWPSPNKGMARTACADRFSRAGI